MGSQPVVFNHVGLCVRDRVASRRFYEGLLGFEFWWELDAPEESTAALLQLARPVGLHATYLVRDGLVLELLDYSGRVVSAGGERVMDQVGLTHISFSVSDLRSVLGRIEVFGGSVVAGAVSEGAAMVRDPDGQLLELLGEGWLGGLPARPQSL
jgi:catechol 2,3-dioxygenase-like lactoylglutathione lyase family enzyme